MQLFLQKHFLHWVEAISLLGLISEVVGMLDLLHTDILVSNLVDSHSWSILIGLGKYNSVLADFLHDAKYFVLKNH
jgi:hypothetical protein